MRSERFFQCCEATEALKHYFGLKGVQAELLRGLGAEVPPECVDGRGYTYPRLTTLPMGFGPSPGIAQAAHEAVLYGEAGTGSEQARQLPPVVSPAAPPAKCRGGTCRNMSKSSITSACGAEASGLSTSGTR